MLYSLLIGLIALIPVLGLCLGLVYFWLAFHREKEKIAATRAERYRRSTTFNYDPNGNPEYIYDPSTGALIIPPTGNSSFAPTILIRDSLQRNVKPDKEQPLLININGGQKVANSSVEGEVISSEDFNPEASTEPKLPASEGELREYISDCIDRGVKMTPAARAIQLKAGDNKPYNSFKALWESIVATKHVPSYLNQSSREGGDC